MLAMDLSFKVLSIVLLLLFSWSAIVVNGSHVWPLDGDDDKPAVPSIVVDNIYRTGYHFQPPRHWMNDPNAPMWYKGIYHLFYQYNPKGSVWGTDIEWAHSVSTDMINWKALDAAVQASKPFDSKGCWSGSATMLPGNRPVIIYTGITKKKHQVQNIAFPKNLSDPYLQEWVKPDYNPIIAPVQGMDVTGFRDPTTAWLGPDKLWRLVVGSLRKHRGLAVLYRSKDFLHWVRVKHPLHSVADTGMWECPDFFPVTTDGKRGVDNSAYDGRLKYVFKVSLESTHFEYYTIGTYRRDLDRYIPDGTSADNSSGLRFDYGNFYASKSFFDASKQRRILWGWSNESDSKQDDIDKGWAGIQTIPRTIWLDGNGRQVVQWPIEEVESLRDKLVVVHNRKLETGGLLEISGIMTSQADVEVIFQLSNLANAEPFDPSWSSDPQKVCHERDAGMKGGVGPFGILVLATAKREEETAVFFRIFRSPTKYVALMCHDPARSSLRLHLYKPTYGGFVDVDIQENGRLYLRSLIDNSVVESFGAKGRTCITSRVYPSLALGSDAHLYAFNNGAEEVTILKLKAWEMKKPMMNL